MINREYFIFVLGYDLLHDRLGGIECDIAHEVCTLIYDDFFDSEENNDMSLSEYEALQKFLEKINLEHYLKEAENE